LLRTHKPKRSNSSAPGRTLWGGEGKGSSMEVERGGIYPEKTDRTEKKFVLSVKFMSGLVLRLQGTKKKGSWKTRGGFSE